jgi:hypothetical protein
MPMGKGTYGSKVGRPAKKKAPAKKPSSRRDPGLDQRIMKLEQQLMNLKKKKKGSK